MAVKILGGDMEFRAILDDKDVQEAGDRILKKFRDLKNGVNSADGTPIVRREVEMRKQVIENINKNLAAQKKLIAENLTYGNSIQSLKQRLKEYKSVSDTTTDTQKRAAYNRKIQETSAEIKRMSNVGKEGFDSMGNAIKKNNGVFSGLVNTIKGGMMAIAGYFAIDSIIGFGKQVVSTTAEFEKFKAVLSNTLGGSAIAELKINEITEFAEKTPFSVSELTDSFVKLANQGFIPTGEEMRKLGDLSASTGKSFDQLAEAILDAQTGEYERLKEFGIKARDAGDKVIFTFKGVATTVEKTSSSIRNYITNLGDVEGVTGSMNAISKTLTGQISNLGDSWDQMLVSVGNNTSGVFSSAISIIGKAINAITSYNNELNLADKYKIGGGGFSKALKDINKAINPFADRVNNSDIQISAIKDLNKELSDQASQFIKTAKSAKDYDDAVKLLYNNGTAKLNEYRSLGKNNPDYYGGDKNFLKGVADQYTQAVRSVQEAKKQFLNPKGDANFGKGKKTAEDHSLERAQALEKKISDLNEKFSLKFMTDDEAALQVVRNEFAAIADEVKKFNENPKNKIKVDGSSLGGTRDKAIADLTYRQQTEKIKIALDEQKELYSKYEEYKVQFGSEAAERRFKGIKDSLGNEFDINKTYLQLIKEKQAEFSSIDPEKLTGSQKERQKEFEKRGKDEIKTQQEAQDKLMADFMSYQKKRLVKAEEYLAYAAELRKTGQDEEADNAIKAGEKALTELDLQHVKELESYKQLTDDIDKLSKKQTKNLIAELQKELQYRILNNTITVEAAKEVQKVIENGQKHLKEWTYEDLNAAALALRNVASEIGAIDENFARLLNTIANVASGFSEIQKQAKVLNDKDATGLDKAVAGAGIVGATVGIISSVVGHFKKLKEAAKQAKKEVADFYAQATAGEHAYQALLRERERQKAREHANTMRGLKAEQDLLKSQQSQIATQSSSLLSQLQGQQYVESTKYKHGTWVRKAKTTQTFGSLAGMSYDQIELLYNQGKLTSGAKTLFEELQKLKKEGEDVADMLKEAAKAADELATGTTADSLSKSIIDDLKAGKNGLSDVMEDYSDIIQNALLSSFESEVVKKEMDAFYSRLAEDAKSGERLTQEEIDARKADYIETRQRIKDAADAFSAISGTSLSDSGKSGTGSGMAGAIKGITADQADILAGRVGGIQLSVVESLKLNRQQFAINQKCFDIAVQNLNTAIRIEANTRRTADASDQYLPYLKSMDAKLADSLGVQLRAAGKYGF